MRTLKIALAAKAIDISSITFTPYKNKEGQWLIMTLDDFEFNESDDLDPPQDILKKFSGFAGFFLYTDTIEDDEGNVYATELSISIDSALWNRGLGKRLYNEALAFVKKKGMRGLASVPDMRTTLSERIWKKNKQEQIVIDGEDFDLLIRPLN